MVNAPKTRPTLVGLDVKLCMFLDPTDFPKYVKVLSKKCSIQKVYHAVINKFGEDRVAKCIDDKWDFKLSEYSKGTTHEIRVLKKNS